MTEVALARTPSISDSWGSDGTPTLARIQDQALIWLSDISRLVQIDASRPPQSLQDRLDQALIQIKRAIRARTPYLHDEDPQPLIGRFAGLFLAEEWGEDDDVPTFRSIDALIMAIVEFDSVFPSISIARGGNLQAAWLADRQKFVVEGMGDGSLSWRRIVEHDDGIERSEGRGSITDFRKYLAS